MTGITVSEIYNRLGLYYPPVVLNIFQMILLSKSGPKKVMNIVIFEGVL